MENPQRLTPKQALEKIKYYCGYEERCHIDVKRKLYEYGVYGYDAAQILTTLIEENYLNEARFAQLFAGSKFRIKHWGKIKITHALQQRNISTYNINKGLQEINEADYLNTLSNLATTKWQSLIDESTHIRRQKTFVYLMAKGYEIDLIESVVKAIQIKK